ncbi:MAG: glycosyltransferase family 4 protein [Fibrobacter sp.]|nr:glycosyltransferase family 4 protein [Fibrobacter sp.]
MNKIKTGNICFFCPSREFGGAENLIIRLTKSLLLRDIKVTIIDYPDGIVKIALSDTNGVVFIDYNQNNILKVEDITHLISFSYWIEKIKRELIVNKNVIIIFWFIHPYHIFHFIKPIQRNKAKYLYFNYKRKIKRMLHVISGKGGLKFMDYENYYIAKEYFELDFKPEYLQIPINKKSIGNNPELRTVSDEISVVWIGRLPIEKVNILIFTIEEIRLWSIRNSQKINFYIIGSGLAENILNDYLSERPFDFVRITRKNSIPPDEIPSFLQDKKLMFAMGTAALEGGAEGVPTVLLDYSYRDYKKIKKLNYKFKWLYQTTDYKLGSDIFKSKNLLIQENHMTIDDIFNLILDNEKRIIIENECYNYCINNHSMEAVMDKLLAYLTQSSFNYSDLLLIDINKNKFELFVDRLHFLKNKVRNRHINSNNLI